jgi:uncharacterized protein
MLKKLSIILFFIMLSFCLNAKDDLKDYTFINKKFGMACQFTDNWKIYTSSKGAPQYFQNMLDSKKKAEDSPLFLGITGDQTSYVRLLLEPYSGDLESYISLLKIVMEQSNIKAEFNFSEDKKNVFITYEAKTNNIPIQFIEYLTIHNGTAVRMGFWSMSVLFNGKKDGFISIAEKTMFQVKENNKLSWKKPWENKFKYGDLNTAVKIPKDNNLNKYMFFPVKGKNNTVYILGSIHIGKDDFYPLSDDIENAFNKTKNLVVEVNVDDPETIKKTKDFASYAYLANNQTLDKILSKELYGMLTKKMTDYGLPMEKFNNFKPWVLGTTLSVVQIMSQGFSADSGTEKYFLKRSKNKNIFEFETFDEQISIFDSIDGNSFLGETLLELESGNNSIDELIDSWKKGDLSEINNITFKEPKNNSNEEYYKKFYYERNQKMVDKIKDYLSKSEDYFVIVGSGHLAGDKGILALLKSSGFSIENLK